MVKNKFKILHYNKWQNFEKIIDKAKISCENSDINAFEHFTDVSKLSKRANNKVIAKNGGTMPEDLPTPKKSLKQLEKENNKIGII